MVTSSVDLFLRDLEFVLASVLLPWTASMLHADLIVFVDGGRLIWLLSVSVLSNKSLAM